MIRTTMAALGAALFAAGAVVATATPSSAASAGGTCTISAPATISIVSPYQRVPVTFGQDCVDQHAYATWDLVHRTQGPVSFAEYDYETHPSRAGFIELYDWDPLGSYTLDADFAANQDTFLTLAQSPVSQAVSVRAGSRIALTATRSGSYVTLAAGASFYKPAADAFVAWPSARTVLQYKSCASCAWTYLKTVYTGTTGKVSLRVLAPKSRYYRAVTTSNSGIWGRTGAQVAR